MLRGLEFLVGLGFWGFRVYGFRGFEDFGGFGEVLALGCLGPGLPGLGLRGRLEKSGVMYGYVGRIWGYIGATCKVLGYCPRTMGDQVEQNMEFGI